MRSYIMNKNIKRLAVLPLRDIVVFPGMVAPLFIGRDKSINALEYTSKYTHDDKIVIVTQKSSSDENPNIDGLYKTGVVAQILQLLKLPDGTIKVIIEAISRASLKTWETTLEEFTPHSDDDAEDHYVQSMENDHTDSDIQSVISKYKAKLPKKKSNDKESKSYFFIADVEILEENDETDDQDDQNTLMKLVLAEFSDCVKLNKKIPSDIMSRLSQISSRVNYLILLPYI